MQEFRRFIRGPVGKLLLAAIVVPFVAVPFLDYFSGSSAADTVADVEGTSITRNQVNQRVERVRDMLRQQSPNMNPAMLDSFVRPEMVLDGLVNEQLILSAAESAGMVYSESQLHPMIRSQELFQVDGKFSNERFERELRARGMSPQGYMRGVRQDLVKEQYRSGFMATDFALPVELDEQRRLGEQVRDIRYAQLDLNALRQTFTVSDEEVQSFYNDNQDEFMRPEEFRIAYVELTSDTYADKVAVSDEDVAAEYEVRKSIMEDSAANTARHVSHILVEVGGDRDLDAAKQRAAEAAAAIAGGMSFAEAATTYSDDPGSANEGGDLGVVSKGALPEEMEAVIATLEPNVVSEPVVSDAGVHLIKVTDVAEKREMPPLEQLAGQIRADLKQARAEAMLAEDVATLEDLLYEHGDLQTPAEQVNTQVVTTEWVPLSSLPAPLASPQVQQALSTDEVRRDGHNSELIEVAPAHYLAVRIAEEKPAEPLPLEDVSFAIRERIKGDMAADKVQTLFGQAEEKVAGGADLETVAQLFDAEVEEQEGLQRGGAEPSMEVVNGVFALPRPAEGESSPVALIRTGNGSVVAYQLTRVEDGNVEPLSSQQQAAALQELGNIEGQRNFRQVLAMLREEGDVELFPSRLSPNADDAQ